MSRASAAPSVDDREATSRHIPGEVSPPARHRPIGHAPGPFPGPPAIAPHRSSSRTSSQRAADGHRDSPSWPGIARMAVGAHSQIGAGYVSRPCRPRSIAEWRPVALAPSSRRHRACSALPTPSGPAAGYGQASVRSHDRSHRLRAAHNGPLLRSAPPSTRSRRDECAWSVATVGRRAVRPPPAGHCRRPARINTARPHAGDHPPVGTEMLAP